MDFEWDDAKAESNLSKHGVGFGARSKPPRYGVPDEDTPELTREMLARARKLNDILIERGLPSIVGRPKSPNPKQAVNLRLDPEIVEHFKAGGKGWQTRINAVLKDFVAAETAPKRSRARKRG